MRFGAEPRIFRAPGRVNVIGEHTDYNQGFVMPANVDLATWTAANGRRGRKVTVFSREFGEAAEFALDEPQPRARGHWSDYVRGVAWALEREGVRLRGANLMIEGEVPIGAGLSSSASLEVSVALALLALSGSALNPTRLALLCQKAENEFVGARCGIMDPFVICRGEAGHTLLLDCRDLSWRPLAVPAAARLVIAHTMVKHDLAAGEYNRRRAECEQAVEILARRLPGVESLRSVSEDQLEMHHAALDEVLYRRARHVISENGRVLTAVKALEAGDLERLGCLMNESHRSLRDDFEVSCRELDAMVEAALELPGVCGARMTGGGFGGCVVALVRTGAVEQFCRALRQSYHQRMGIEPWVHVTAIAGGASEAPGQKAVAGSRPGDSLSV